MKKVKQFLGSPWGQRAVLFVIICVVMAIFEPKFFSGANMSSILLSIALIGIMACGMLFVVLIGGLDLSVGSVAACAGSYLTYTWINGEYTTSALITGLLLGLLVGVLVGLLHGVMVAFFNLPSFVVTLATQYLVYGYVILYTNGSFLYPVKQGANDIFWAIGNARFLGLTMPVWIFIAIVIITAFVLSKTTFGRRLYAVGGSARGSKLVGIKTRGTTVIAYVVSSVCAAIAGMILVSMNQVAGCTTASGYEGNVLMIMVVGGINLAGGEGGISGAVFGSLLVGILNNIMILLSVPSDYIKAIQGVIIIAAVALNVYTARKAAGLIQPKAKKAKTAQ